MVGIFTWTVEFTTAEGTSVNGSIRIIIVPRIECTKQLLPDVTIPRGRIYDVPIRN